MAVLYARLLKIDNGENANEVIRAVSKNFPEVSKSLPQEVVPRGRKRGGRGGPGSLEARRKIEDPGEPSLFDDSENDEVAETAAREALQEANQKLAQAHTESIASVAAAVDSAPTPQAKAAIYAMGIHSLTANHQIQPGQMPANYDPSLDPMIKGWAKMGISAQQQTQDANAASLADSSARRADAAEKRADVAQDRAAAAADAESWKPSGTRGGKQVYYNAKTGEEKLGGPVDMAPDKASGQNGNSLTPDAQAKTESVVLPITEFAAHTQCPLPAPLPNRARR